VSGRLSYSVVVPTVGRPELRRMLRALAAAAGPLPERVVVVDDRRDDEPALHLDLPGELGARIEVRRGAGRGPAAARNVGWRSANSEWVAFLDDDVVPAGDWRRSLAADLSRLPAQVGGSQGRVDVPLPPCRRPTDWERNTAGLACAHWITADIAYRRDALERVGGFDERFRRAYREDADLALRIRDAGFGLVRGDRLVRHPVRAADPWVSLRVQAGNADDVLMRKLHGPGWRVAADAPGGRLPAHATTTALLALALVAVVAGRRRMAATAAAGWLCATAELAWSRISPGPRTSGEVRTILVTSAIMPAVATYHRLAGLVRHRRVPPWGARPLAVLFDRDGTLVEDVPYNGDPDKVRPVDGAREALDRLHAAGVLVAVVTNQSGIGRGLVHPDDVAAVNARVEELLGPFAAWEMCPHAPEDGCRCRKPKPTLIRRAARRLGVPVERCVVVGDIGSDVDAARSAGARALLVPNAITLPEEVGAAPEIAPDLGAAADALLGCRTVTQGGAS